MAVSVRVGDRPEPRMGGALGAAVVSALLFAPLPLVPVLSCLAAVSPLPLIIQRLRRGLGSALLSALLAAALVGWAFWPGLALGFLLTLVSPGLLLSEAMARGRGLRRGCAWAFMLLAGEIVLALVFASPAIAAKVLQFFDALRSPEFLAQMRARFPQENVDEFAAQATSLYHVMEVVYPAAFVIMAALVVLANAALLRYYLARRDPGWLEGGEFEGIKWPLGFVVTFVAAGACVVVPPLRSAAYNVLLVVAFFFALQGLAVAAYFAHRLAGPAPLRAAVLALVLLNPWAPQILALLGLFDTWFNFRRWAEPPRAEEK
jgi:uncharacterized protein YybS (DUF2232 family)